jgi:hypothetical protein
LKSIRKLHCLDFFFLLENLYNDGNLSSILSKCLKSYKYNT